MTLYVDEESLTFAVNEVSLDAEGAISYPVTRDARGFPLHPVLAMTRVAGNKWSGQIDVIYYQAGSYGANVTLKGPLRDNPSV